MSDKNQKEIEKLKNRIQDLENQIDLYEGVLDDFDIEEIPSIIRINHFNEIEVCVDYRWYSMDELVSRTKEGRQC